MIKNIKNRWKRLTKTSITVSLWCFILLGLTSVLLLLAPALVRETEAVRRNVCANHLRQIAQAIRMYRDSWGQWPPVYTVDHEGKPLHSWRVLILPYLNDYANLRLYHSIRLNEPWNSRFNSRFHNKMPSVFRCPSLRTEPKSTHSPQISTTNPTCPNKLSVNKSCAYFLIAAGNVRTDSTNTLQHTNSANTLTNNAVPIINTAANDFNTSNRILVVEQREPVNWMTPDKEPNLNTACRGINSISGGLGSFHPGGMNAAMADGSVRFLNEAIDLHVLQTLMIGPHK